MVHSCWWRLFQDWRHRDIDFCALSISLCGRLDVAEKPSKRKGIRSLTGRKMLRKKLMLISGVRRGRGMAAFTSKYTPSRYKKGNEHAAERSFLCWSRNNGKLTLPVGEYSITSVIVAADLESFDSWISGDEGVGCWRTPLKQSTKDKSCLHGKSIAPIRPCLT